MPIPPSHRDLKERMERELRQNILPFWIEHTVDHEKGGFYGALTNDLQVRDEVERSLVLCARLLWTYAAAYRAFNDATYLAMADHAYAYLTGPFLDRHFGGMFWQLDRDGRPVNDRKQTYGQAFAIYGLSEYFLATGKPAVLHQAIDLFQRIERHAYDPVCGGYVEGCARSWGLLDDMRLSEKEINCPKTMNTLLHVIEGYTNLLRAWEEPHLKEQLRCLVEVFLDHVVDPQTHFTRLFFENDWRSLSDHVSYGHDIESSWLLCEAAEVLGDQALMERALENALQMAGAVYAHGLDSDGSLLNEDSPHGLLNGDKHWWVEVEGVVGFYNAYQLCQPGDPRKGQFAAAALSLWDYIEAKMVDRQNGEWFKILNRDGTLKMEQVKTGPWECPYHHSRACMEIVRRVAA